MAELAVLVYLALVLMVAQAVPELIVVVAAAVVEVQ